MKKTLLIAILSLALVVPFLTPRQASAFGGGPFLVLETLDSESGSTPKSEEKPKKAKKAEKVEEKKEMKDNKSDMPAQPKKEKKAKKAKKTATPEAKQ